ncbi:MAG: KEOPS complex kinase/ATPase Bud32 [Candidatus Altiarchaeota archaeon]
MELMGKGAEANLYHDGGRLVKERVCKKYRIPEVDSRLRRQRTNREGQLLQKAREVGVMAPKVFEVDAKGYRIVMEYVDGVLLKDFLDSASVDEVKSIAGSVGASLRRLHGADVIHNDLTTSNMILKEGKVFFIDFGLSFRSRRLEDRAMDLVVFKKSILATHTPRLDLIWDSVVSGYGADENMLARVRQIEKRVRYA